MSIIEQIESKARSGKKQLYILTDPDKFFHNDYASLIRNANRTQADLFLIGGSLITEGIFSHTVSYLKQNTSIPLCIFPGNFLQVQKDADAIFFLSLISGRNPEFLIGNQVLAVPLIRKTNLEVIPVGYILVDGGAISAVQYMSNTIPVPSNKPEIAACTALAGQYLGMKCIFIDAGSGANLSVSGDFIRVVKSMINIPLIVGGGIKTVEQAKEIYDSGADAIVIGNSTETNPGLILEIKQNIL